eukprot:7317-Heterococcus_DN1.PRE.3
MQHNATQHISIEVREQLLAHNYSDVNKRSKCCSSTAVWSRLRNDYMTQQHAKGSTFEVQW